MYFNTVPSNEMGTFLQAPTSLLGGSLEDLVTYLIQLAKTDLEKSRSLLRWLTAQDLSKMKSGARGERTPMSMLSAVKDETGSYTSIYAQMCRYIVVFL